MNQAVQAHDAQHDDEQDTANNVVVLGSSRMESLQSTMTDLLDKLVSGHIDLERAKTANEMCRTIIASAKVEAEFFAATGIKPMKAMCLPESHVTVRKLPTSGTATTIETANGVSTIVQQLSGR